MGIKANKDALVTVLEELEGAGQPLQDVFGFMNPTLDRFPVAMVAYASGGTKTRLDTSADWLTSNFEVYVIFRESKTQDDVDQVYTVLDQVISKLTSTTNVDTLGGTVEKFDVVSIDPVQFTDATNVMGFRILVSMSEIYPFT